MSVRTIFMVGFICTSNFVFSQNLDTLKLRAALLVHADFNDFSIEGKNNNLEYIVNKYNVVSLKSSEILDCDFFKVSIKDTLCKCDYFLAFNSRDINFYRLRGFRTSEFNDFANQVLLGGYVRIPKNIKDAKANKILEYIVKNTQVEGINLSEYYLEYYKRPMNSLYDKFSCLRKFRIIEYKK